MKKKKVGYLTKIKYMWTLYAVECDSNKLYYVFIKH